jgi:hypothetical protein
VVGVLVVAECDVVVIVVVFAGELVVVVLSEGVAVVVVFEGEEVVVLPEGEVVVPLEEDVFPPPPPRQPLSTTPNTKIPTKIRLNRLFLIVLTLSAFAI